MRRQRESNGLLRRERVLGVNLQSNPPKSERSDPRTQRPSPNARTRTDMTYQSVNPSDGKVLKTFPELTDSQLEAAIATAATCFQSWRQKTYAERATVVSKAAALLHARADEFARHATVEVGKRDRRGPRRGGVQLEQGICDD
jgi:acyl-CoA reductase-like NAD-dependent aldehyde dehydrogenase